MPERNISVFNNDTAQHGGYICTSVDRWSTRVADGRQGDEIIQLIEQHFQRSIRIVDIGCGDGVFTIKLAERFRPEYVRGVEPAALAIDSARRRIPTELSDKIGFDVGTIYDVQARPGESLAVARGMLHHLDDPRSAIAQLSRQFPTVIVLEPNGYNPGLKVIEKLSRYHRQHDEKSYWPPTLNKWFAEAGYSVVSHKCFGLVPYFCPTVIAKMLKTVEPLIEALPIVKNLSCSANLMLYRKRSANPMVFKPAGG